MKSFSMYGLSSCPWCQKAKQYFDERAVPYSYVDYDLASAEEQKRISEEMSSFRMKGFPVVKYGEEAVVGYSQEKYSELFKSASYESSAACASSACASSESYESSAACASSAAYESSAACASSKSSK
jgi:glutaredoxin